MSTSPNEAWWPGAAAAHARRPHRMRAAFGTLAAATDAAVILLVSVGAGAFYHRTVYGSLGHLSDFIEIGLLAAWLYLVASFYRAEYSVANYIEYRKHPQHIGQLWSLTFVCLITIGFLTKSSGTYSRGWVILFYLAGLPCLMLAHMLLVHVLATARQTGIIVAHRLLLVGLHADIKDFLERHKPRSRGLDIVGIATLPHPTAFDGATGASQFDAALGAAVRRARALNPDGVFLAVPWSDEAMINRCVEAFMTIPASVHLTPGQLFERFNNAAVVRVGPVASLHLLRPPLSLLAIVIKRSLDIVLSAGALILLLPVFAAVAVAIRLDSEGPVFFVQRRYGFNQRPFSIIKFRTMTTLDNGAVIAQATRHDSRFTRLGALLRRCNVDELPQLFNVLLGDMSLVGPRPHALAHDRAWGDTIALYARRHNVKPGITGWAQVNGFRGIIDSDERLHGRIACDLYYIDNWSVWLDFKILVATVLWRQAYRNAH